MLPAITDGAPATDDKTIGDKKLSELNGASGITEGYVTLTTQDDGYKKNHTYIKITSDMTVNDFMKELEKAGS